jgi:hypothetical protein
LAVTLLDRVSGVRVIVSYTAFRDHDAVARSLRVVNGGDVDRHVTRAFSASLDLPCADMQLLQLPGAWARERQVELTPLRNGVQAVQSSRGTSSHQHNPCIALLDPGANEEQGEVRGVILAYSGCFIAQVEVDQFATARVQAGMDAPGFRWRLAPGEILQSPEAILVWSGQGLGAMSRTCHRLFRTRLARGRFRDAERPILINNWEATYFNFDTDYHLYDAENRAHAWANSDAATHLLQLYHGDGLISVVSDSWIWENANIGEYDNAWLLWYMTQDSQVTLLYRADRDNLLSLLNEHFPQALVSLALLLAFALWHLGQRQGPMLQPVTRNRRQLQEHVRASADFLLRHNGQHNLLQGLQQDIQRRARHRHPGFERLPVAEQWQVLGRLTRQPSSLISQAMRPLPKQRLAAADFTRQVANLQTLRNAL